MLEAMGIHRQIFRLLRFLLLLAFFWFSISCTMVDESSMDFWLSNETIGTELDRLKSPVPDRIIERGVGTTILRYISKDSFFDVTVRGGRVESLQYGSTRFDPDQVLDRFMELYSPEGRWLVYERPFLGEKTRIHVRRDKSVSLFKSDRNVFVYQGEFLGDQSEVIISTETNGDL